MKLDSEQLKTLEKLQELEARTTPGEWYWSGNAICAQAQRGNLSEKLLWPANAMSSEEDNFTQTMGACGLSAEVCARDNMEYLIACANFVRNLVKK